MDETAKPNQDEPAVIMLKENGTELRSRGVPPTTPINGTKPADPVKAEKADQRTGGEAKSGSRFSKVKAQYKAAVRPCLLKHNPLPEYPSLPQRVKNFFLLPPHGKLAQYLQFAIVCLQVWGVLLALTKESAYPGSNFFSLIVLFVCCVVGGYAISHTRLPPLLGMLIMGVLLRNVPGIKAVGENIDTKWAGALRKLALTVILTRAGLGLDIVKLKKLSFAVLRLAFTPCLAEALTVAIVSHFLLDFPWKWSLMLGCILGALSPAVTVPCLVNLQDRKYGVAKGIPTMGLAAGGLDNVACITGFAVLFGIIFSEGSLAMTIVSGPLGVVVGIAYGFVMGFLMWYLPARDSDNSLFYRFMILMCSGMIAIFGSSAVKLSGAGPLGCLTTATVAAYKWRQRKETGELEEIAGVMALAWLIVQHFLFGLIGAAVDVSDIKGSTAGLGIATLAIGLCVRSVVSFTVTLGTGFNIKERIFLTLTWLSKATVQAAIGGLALDRALSPDPEDRDEAVVTMATDVLTISVLAIIICAPVGATCMALLGPKFLAKGDEELDIELSVCEKEGSFSPGTESEMNIFTAESDPVASQDWVNTSLTMQLSPTSTATVTVEEEDSQPQTTAVDGAGEATEPTLTPQTTVLVSAEPRDIVNGKDESTEQFITPQTTVPVLAEPRDNVGGKEDQNPQVHTDIVESAVTDEESYEQKRFSSELKIQLKVADKAESATTNGGLTDTPAAVEQHHDGSTETDTSPQGEENS